MNKNWTILLFIFLVANFGICGSTYAGEWHFPVGLSYISGVNDIGDLFEDNLEAESYIYSADITVIPVGITFRPYYEYDNGVGFGMDFGPTMIMLSNEDDIDADFFNLPINVTCRYAITPDASVSPYVRAGISYNISSGDYKESSKPGLFAAVGVEMMRTKAVNLGIEFAYDSSEIEFEDHTDYYGGGIKKIKPGGFIFTFSVIF